jgi:hypothetical protein
MKSSLHEFFLFRRAVGLVGALIMIVGAPIWMPLMLYLNRPTIPKEVEDAYRLAHMATNSAKPVEPGPAGR